VNSNSSVTFTELAVALSEEGRLADDLDELGRYYRSYAELMGHWRRVLPRDWMLEVRDLVEDLEYEVRRIIDYCGFEWDPACLTFHETTRPVRTASFGQVRRPIYRSSVGRWRPFEPYLRPLLDALYPRSDSPASRLD
jgi:hypothetical protein